MDALTTRQQHILDFIRDSINHAGMPPTRAEIQSLRTDLTSRLDRIDANVSALLAAPPPTVSRPYTRPER